MCLVREQRWEQNDLKMGRIFFSASKYKIMQRERVCGHRHLRGSQEASRLLVTLSPFVLGGSISSSPPSPSYVLSHSSWSPNVTSLAAGSVTHHQSWWQKAGWNYLAWGGFLNAPVSEWD